MVGSGAGNQILNEKVNPLAWTQTKAIPQNSLPKCERYVWRANHTTYLTLGGIR